MASYKHQRAIWTAAALTASLNRKLDKFLIGASASHSSDGKNALGLTVSLAVGENPRTGDFEIYPDNTARDGMITARAFHDSNGNGVFDDGETPIENASFRVGHGDSNTPTDQDGAVLLRNIPPETRTSFSLDGNSLDNPYLFNNTPGFDVVARAGVPVRIDFPVASSGDVEGTVYSENKDGSHEGAANVIVQVITGNGKVVKETRTGFDGYYLINAIPTGFYSLRISPEQAERLGFFAEPNRGFIITSGEDTSHVLDMIISR